MALVRISKELIADVENKARAMCEAEVKDLLDSPETQPPGFAQSAADLAHSIAWGPHKHLEQQLPAAWKKTASKLNIEFRSSCGSVIEWDCFLAPPSLVSFPHHIDASYDYAAKNGSRYYYELKVEIHGGDIASIAANPDATGHLACVTALKKITLKKQADQLRLTWRSRTVELTSFLNKCKSLNEALKLWPAFAMYVSRSYIDRVESKVERSTPTNKAAEALETIATEELTAAAMAARLAGVIA